MSSARQEELIRLLWQPCKGGSRDIYRGRNLSYWFITYDGLASAPFTFSEFEPLIERGILERTYPETADSYRIKHEAAW